MLLLERQVSLIEYMTSGDAIWGRDEDISPAPDLLGIDRALLRVEAQFSYAKRMDKIAAVFPKTFELLGRDETIARKFVEICPPTTINRLQNARQFHRFLSSRWMREAPNPPYLCDVAACELGYAEVDAGIEDRGPPLAPIEHPARQHKIRRSPAVVLLRCAYDIRPVFETDLEQAAPMKRDTPLVIAILAGSDHPQVFEVIPAVFDLLAALDDWTDVLLVQADRHLDKFLADLAACRFIEVRR